MLRFTTWARLVAACAFVALAIGGWAAGAAGATALPDERAYELVSPPTKNGLDVMDNAARVRASVDGDRVTFASLGAFGDVHGTGVSTEYMSRRAVTAEPGNNGWATHGITPLQQPLTLLGAFRAADPIYEGELSDDLASGVFRAWSPLTDDPSVANVENLYVRHDLDSAGPGTYELASSCPLCEMTSTPLPPGLPVLPYLAGASADFEKVIFESIFQLTSDAPASSGPKLYESNQGALRYVGVLPDGTSADRSIAGAGAGTTGQLRYTRGTISRDGSRISFTVGGRDDDISGALYLRDDQATATTADDTTVQLNAVSGGDGSGGSAATFWAASSGVDALGARAPMRVFFTSQQQLTSDATGGTTDVYMWDEQPVTEVERVTIAATSGTFTLMYGGQATGPIASNASAATVESALNALPSIGGVGGSVTVTGGPGDAAGSTPYEVSFGGSLAGISMTPISVDASGLGAAVGTMLSCASGPSFATRTYQWLRDGVPIGGATSSTYTTVGADAGAVVQCQVFAITMSSGATQVSDGTVISPFPVTAPPAPPTSIAAPAITTGTLTVGGAGGATLTCDPGTWTGGATFTYQWYRSGVALVGNGADTSVYTVQTADLATAATFQCAVMGTNAGGAATRVSANLTTSPGPRFPAAPTATAATTLATPLGRETTVTPGGHLSVISRDDEPGDGHSVLGVVGTSDDGSWVYFMSAGQLVAGQPLLSADVGMYAWHAGSLRYIGRVPAAADEGANMPGSWNAQAVLSRVTPDGSHLLFSSQTGFNGYDQTACADGQGCREFYVYDGVTDELACASCNPAVPPTTSASNEHRGAVGGSNTTWHVNHPFSNDGRWVFFHTAEALVPQDTNGRVDVYEYDTQTHEQHLLSSGTDPSDSYFMDASADGRNAFIATRERLNGWDTDGNYDLYDVRVGGGFDDPPPPARLCSGDTCQGALTLPPGAQSFGSSLLTTRSGNVVPVSKKVSKSLTKSQKLKQALKACKSKHGKAKRKKCERTARKRFGKSGGSK